MSRSAPAPGLWPVDPGINVLVVSFDAMRADALGTYGYPRRTSPGIDRFAEDSVVFERAYAASPITPTSFAAAWAGRMPHKVFRRWRFVAETTVGELFADAGYRTAAFLNNVNLTEERGFGRGFDNYRWYRQTSDAQVLEEAVAWLAAHRDERFFAWIHFNAPHAPYERRKLAGHLYAEDYQGRFRETTRGTFHTDDPAEIARIRSLYDGEVFFADSLFQSLMERVSGLGLKQRTAVVLTSDHGEEFYERGGFQHKLLYEEVTRVPLLVHHPGGGGGLRVKDPVGHLDLLPTLAGLVGLEVPRGLDGHDLRTGAPEGRIVVSEAMTNPDYRAFAAVLGSLKLILQCVPERFPSLYDLTEDPAETRNLAEDRSEAVRDIYASLHDQVGRRPCQAIMTGTGDADPADGLDEHSIRALKALGYLGGE